MRRSSRTQWVAASVALDPARRPTARRLNDPDQEGDHGER